jgi:hypothetical protein
MSKVTSATRIAVGLGGRPLDPSEWPIIKKTLTRNRNKPCMNELISPSLTKERKKTITKQLFTEWKSEKKEQMKLRKIERNAKPLTKFYIPPTDYNFYNWKSLELQSGKLTELEIQNGGEVLVAALKIKGVMAEHLDTVLWFLRVTAMKMKMPSIVINLPTSTKTWVVNKGPFVHAKAKGFIP